MTPSTTLALTSHVDILHKFVAFINANAGTLNILLTASLAVSTVIYAVINGKMLGEMRAARLRLDKPSIQISLEPQARWGNFFDLVIENLGNVSVSDLKLKIEPPGLKTLGDRKLEDLPLFKRPIPTFGVRQKISTLAILYIDFIHSDQPKEITISAEYKTSNGQSRIESYRFDMAVYDGMSTSSESSLNDVVKELKRISEGAEKVSRYFDAKELIKSAEDAHKVARSDLAT